MVAEQDTEEHQKKDCCSLAKISMVAERERQDVIRYYGCSLAKISMVAELASIL